LQVNNKADYLKISIHSPLAEADVLHNFSFCKDIMISIHSPLAEADIVCQSGMEEKDISIHSPLAEADQTT